MRTVLLLATAIALVAGMANTTATSGTDYVEGMRISNGSELYYWIVDADFTGRYVSVLFEPVISPRCDSHGSYGDRSYCVFTWRSYDSPRATVQRALEELESEYNIDSDVIDQIHIKYFVQAETSHAYRSDAGTVELTAGPVDGEECLYEGDDCTAIELWSEYNLYWNSGGDESVGYTCLDDAGARHMEDSWVLVSAGNAYHSSYPTADSRAFGSSSETGTRLTLRSNLLHQYMIQDDRC